jgi:hypothetical protein
MCFCVASARVNIRAGKMLNVLHIDADYIGCGRNSELIISKYNILLKVPYFPVDNALLMYNAHPVFSVLTNFLIDTAHLMYTAHPKIHGIVRLAVARPVFRYFGIFSILIA